jgi:hypothetical protein
VLQKKTEQIKAGVRLFIGSWTVAGVQTVIPSAINQSVPLARETSYRTALTYVRQIFVVHWKLPAKPA